MKNNSREASLRARFQYASLRIWALVLSTTLVMLAAPYITSKGWRSNFDGLNRTYSPVSGPKTVSRASLSQPTAQPGNVETPQPTAGSSQKLRVPLTPLVYSPQIYIYDLPAKFQPCSESAYNFENYGAERRVPEVLRGTSYVTTDPSLADLFYVPAHLYCMQGKDGLKDHITGAMRVLSHIRSEYPFWNASGGADHVWLFTHDHGFCGFATNEGIPEEVASSIILSHWGLEHAELPCSLEDRIHRGGCPVREHDRVHGNGLRCFNPRKDIVIASTAMDGLIMQPATDVESSAPAPTNMEDASRPTADTLDVKPLRRLHQLEAATAALQALQAATAWAGSLPAEGAYSNIEEAAMWSSVGASVEAPTTAPMAPKEPNLAQTVLGKEHVLFFAGDTRPDDITYSHGVRQSLVAMFSNTPGFKIVDSSKTPLDFSEILYEMDRSVFCLASTGAGWGVRFKLAAMMRCIPVIIADGVQFEYEEILPYHEFSIRIPQHAMYRLPVVLNSLLENEPELVRRMKRRLDCAWAFFSWKDGYGKAREALLCSLRRRLPGGENIQPALDYGMCKLMCGDVYRRP